MTQPAISQHIHALEEYYGARLFERSSKRVELTQAGSTLYGYAVEILELHSLARRAVSDLVERVTGKLTMGASFTLGEYVLPRIMAAFADRYPEVRFTVTIGNTELVHERIREGSIDIGLVEGLIEDTDLYIQPFLQDELVLVVSKKHPLARKNFAVKEDLAYSTFIMREEGSGTRLAVDELLKKMDLRPRRAITLGSTQAIKEAVEAGLGISFLSKWTLRKELQLGSLKPVRIKDVDMTRGLYVVQNQEKFESRACAEFAAFVTAPDIIRLLG